MTDFFISTGISQGRIEIDTMTDSSLANEGVDDSAWQDVDGVPEYRIGSKDQLSITF